MKEVFNTYDYEPKINSTTMRLSVLEDRMKSLEKMLRLFEERINIKKTDKKETKKITKISIAVDTNDIKKKENIKINNNNNRHTRKKIKKK